MNTASGYARNSGGKLIKLQWNDTTARWVVSIDGKEMSAYALWDDAMRDYMQAIDWAKNGSPTGRKVVMAQARREANTFWGVSFAVLAMALAVLGIIVSLIALFADDAEGQGLAPACEGVAVDWESFVTWDDFGYLEVHFSDGSVDAQSNVPEGTTYFSPEGETITLLVKCEAPPSTPTPPPTSSPTPAPTAPTVTPSATPGATPTTPPTSPTPPPAVTPTVTPTPVASLTPGPTVTPSGPPPVLETPSPTPTTPSGTPGLTPSPTPKLPETPEPSSPKPPKLAETGSNVKRVVAGALGLIALGTLAFLLRRKNDE